MHPYTLTHTYADLFTAYSLFKRTASNATNYASQHYVPLRAISYPSGRFCYLLQYSLSLLSASFLAHTHTSSRLLDKVEHIPYTRALARYDPTIFLLSLSLRRGNFYIRDEIAIEHRRVPMGYSPLSLACRPMGASAVPKIFDAGRPFFSLSSLLYGSCTGYSRGEKVHARAG